MIPYWRRRTTHVAVMSSWKSLMRVSRSVITRQGEGRGPGATLVGAESRPHRAEDGCGK